MKCPYCGENVLSESDYEITMIIDECPFGICYPFSFPSVPSFGKRYISKGHWKLWPEVFDRPKHDEIELFNKSWNELIPYANIQPRHFEIGMDMIGLWCKSHSCCLYGGGFGNHIEDCLSKVSETNLFRTRLRKIEGEDKE